MKSSILYTSVLLAALMSIDAKAELCSDRYYNDVSSTQCATAATGAVVGTGAGIYSAIKYSKARLIEEKNTSVLFSDANPRVTGVRDLIRELTPIKDGDKITLDYHLSEEANRAHHINVMESNARSAESSASYHYHKSLTAMEDVYENVSYQDTDSKGKTVTRYRREKVGERPDYAARARHRMQSEQYEQEARDYWEKAADAKRGGPVPTYTFHEEIDEKLHNRQRVESFLDEQERAGSRVFKLKRLPMKFNLMVKSASRKGAAGIAGALVGAAFAVEEISAGMAAEKIEESTTFRPNIRSLFNRNDK